MYLINASTLKLERFDDHTRLPAYAILSHTWSHTEVTFERAHELQDNEHSEGEVLKNSSSMRSDTQKIRMTCAQALDDGLKYAWVDTCCIDKRSSAELSEAINSMWKWYSQATVCYAYLDDVEASKPTESGELDQYGIPEDLWFADIVSVEKADLARARWFTRGWTLQELLAPLRMVFYGKRWAYLGTKAALKATISEITRVDQGAFRRAELRNFSIAQRMSWAARRETTRIEDLAYSLLGLFDVNMPLLYGEGGKAFERLQEEIMKDNSDQTLLAWAPTYKKQMISRMASAHWRSVFASHPDEFASASLAKYPFPSAETFALTNKGLRISIPVVPLEPSDRIDCWTKNFAYLYNPVLHEKPLFLVILDCTFAQGEFRHHRVGIVCQRIVGTTDQLVRHNSAALHPVDHRVFEKAHRLDVYLLKKIPPPGGPPITRQFMMAQHIASGTRSRLDHAIIPEPLEARKPCPDGFSSLVKNEQDSHGALDTPKLMVHPQR